jgi:two-component system nitrogen regulation sensor histidine kinase GlnL
MSAERLIDSLTTAVLALDRTLCVRYINPAAQALLELSEARSVGSALDSVLPHSETWTQPIHSALEDRALHTSRSTLITLGSGRDITVDMSITPLDEGLTDYACLIELQPMDRVLRISREEQSLAAQETTRAMLRGLAHEIKNPLGGVRGAAQLLARELPDPALGEYTQIIIEEADRLRALVDRLLGPNRRPQLGWINVHEILEHVRNLVHAEFGSAISLSRDYDPSLPELHGDRTQLVQAVLNIARNACEALLESGTAEPCLTLRTRAQRQFTIGHQRHRLVCRVDIEDNGPGISETLLPSIFIPMVSGRAEGTGLGLSIAQTIVAQHEGLIECHSRRGETTFSLYLPLEQHHE